MNTSVGTTITLSILYHQLPHAAPLGMGPASCSGGTLVTAELLPAHVPAHSMPAVVAGPGLAWAWAGLGPFASPRADHGLVGRSHHVMGLARICAQLL